MTKMKLSRMFTLVLGLAAALSQGCGSDASSSGGGSGGAGAMGSGGASSGAPSSCTPTKCTKDPDYSMFPQPYCDAIAASKCGAQNKAMVDCSLAHDSCLPDGNQDFAKVEAACQSQFAALDACSSANM